MLARELLNKPDGFITANYMDGEYIIGDIKKSFYTCKYR